MHKDSAHEHTGQWRQSGIPCATVLTVSFVLSPVIGLSCHRRGAATALDPLGSMRNRAT
jgi:hypothetical protein